MAKARTTELAANIALTAGQQKVGGNIPTNAHGQIVLLVEMVTATTVSIFAKVVDENDIEYAFSALVGAVPALASQDEVQITENIAVPFEVRGAPEMAFYMTGNGTATVRYNLS